MRVFEIPNLCPKCDSPAASYKHHETPCLDVAAHGEHWHRQCPFCGYEWAEAPLTPTHAAGDVSAGRTGS